MDNAKGLNPQHGKLAQSYNVALFLIKQRKKISLNKKEETNFFKKPRRWCSGYSTGLKSMESQHVPE